MVFDSARFDLRPYTGFETDRFVRRTFCSWEHAGWRSLLVQRFEHGPVAEDMALPGAADLHLVLPVSGHAEMETRDGGRAIHDRWLPGRLQLGIPHFEAMAASVATGDPLLEEAVRALGFPGAADELYAETAAAFLTTHLLTRHGRLRADRPPAQQDTRVRAAVAFLRERLAEPITLADLADEVHLSVYHLIRMFRNATGQTPHRFLTGLRVEEAKRLLRETGLALDRLAPRCGFTSSGALSAAFVRHTGTRPSVYRNS